MNSFYTRDELYDMKFSSIGKNVLISRKASIYSVQDIIIGNNVRIDDFCVLSGRISLGNYVHIAAGSMLFGGDEGILLEDFSTLSSRTAVYAKSDDYSGESLTNPMVPDEYKRVTNKRVIIGKHVIVGAGSVILPGVVIGEGCAVGAMSLVKKSLDPWGIYAGNPCDFIKARSKKLMDLEKSLTHTVI